MNITCQDRDRIFADGTPAEWAALEVHAATCGTCAEELRAWKALSAAAAEMRDYSESPSLWPRIRQSLIEQSEQHAKSRARWNLAWLWPDFSMRQAVIVAAVLLLLISPIIWRVYFPRSTRQPEAEALLRKKALSDVQRTQSAYVEAINKLAAEAKPQLENVDTPLMANYREKLLVLDSAISDLQAQAGQNPSNAHLRYQLLAMYQEKQRTLEEILEEKR
jgi:hypothetical protein